MKPKNKASIVAKRSKRKVIHVYQSPYIEDWRMSKIADAADQINGFAIIFRVASVAALLCWIGYHILDIIQSHSSH